MESNKLTFAVVNPYTVRHGETSKETVLKNKDYVEWGDTNTFPQYLTELCKTAPTLASIIEGSVDYTVGDDVVLNRHANDNQVVNKTGERVIDLVRKMSRDLWRYDGVALQVIRDVKGNVADIYHLDMRYIRSNKDNTVFYYNEKWGNKNYGASNKVLVYPAYIEGLNYSRLSLDEQGRNASSVLFFKGDSDSVYPQPTYQAALKSCEIEREIDTFHRNAIDNGFAASYMINFNNGTPKTEDAREEIERSVYEKFGGAKNAGSILLNFAEDKEHAATVQPLRSDDFGERYKALSTHCRQQVFTAFRANPNLFGIPTEGNGFANEQYAESFKLYNRTHIAPMQRTICDMFERIYGISEVLTITPFTLEGAGEGQIS